MQKDTIETDTIFNFMDMEGIKKYLIDYPHLLIIFEFLVIHIDDYIKLSKLNNINNTARSSHI